MKGHLKCAAYLANTLSSMGLNINTLNTPEILSREDERGWEQFRRKHHIGSKIQVPSVWATAGAPAAEAECTLIFFGHYDVVTAFDGNWRQPDPFTLVEEPPHVYGRGVMDMKGGMAAQLAAIGAFSGTALPSRTRLAFLATPFEEKEGHYGAKVVLDHLLDSGEINPCHKNFVIVGESTGLNVLTVRRASYNYEIEVDLSCPPVSGADVIDFKGTKIHAGNFNIFDFRGHNQKHALYELARAYGEQKLVGRPIWLEAGQPSSQSPTGITPNLYNVTPAIARLFKARNSGEKTPVERILQFLYEVSCCADWQKDSATERGISLNSYLRNKGETRYTFGTNIRILSDNTDLIEETFRSAALKAGLPEGEFIIGKFKFDQRGSRLSRIAGEIVGQETGWKPNIEYMGNGCSDGQFAARRRLDVVEIGPIGENEHGPNESATIESLVQTANIYYQLIERLLA